MMKTKYLVKGLFILLLGLLLIGNTAFAKDKYKSTVNNVDLEKPAAFGETIVDIGKVHNYFNNTSFTQLGSEEFTFTIGDDAAANPSMMWLEGGYSLNHYLYFGVCRFAVDGQEIHFSGLTSEDWEVLKNDPSAKSAYQISFSMTDELAGALSLGFTAKQTVHAWSESYRDDFFIIEYDLTNNSGSDFNDLYVWLHMDADISAAGGGSGTLAYYRDDLPDYYLGTDANGNPEHLSYMYDGDNADISGDDTGGKLSPKESLGYIGSRILDCPARVDATGAEIAGTENTQSGHQWWDWNSDPDINVVGDFEKLARQQVFKPAPGSPHDYRYMQILGPMNIDNGETVHIAWGYGLGEGLDGLRKNLQWAYDLYHNDFQGPSAPDAPDVMISKGDGYIKINWDDKSETSADPLTGEMDFEGYRIYRSLDKTNWTLLVDYDLVDDLGDNTGLPMTNTSGLYEYTDTDVVNGFVYYYTVSAYDKGSADLASLETGKTTNYFAEPGPVATSKALVEDAIRVVPNPFVVKAPWDFTPTQDNPSEERLQFQNVPLGAKITVFNLAGDKIIELKQQGSDGYVNWDLITRNTQKVVSGTYLYVVEADNGDTFIDKFVVVR